MAFKAVIFDFDGLMVDTEAAAYQAWQEIYDRYGATLKLEDWVKCVGASYSHFDAVTYLQEQVDSATPLDRAALMQEKNDRKAEICAKLPPLPGVVELIVLAEESSAKLAVASSSAADWVHPHLERLELMDRFHAVTTGDQVKNVKPDPELYLTSAAKLGVSADKCLVLEDSLNGVKAARAAGMAVFAVPNSITGGLDFSEATRVLKSLEDISKDLSIF